MNKILKILVLSFTSVLITEALQAGGSGEDRRLAEKAKAALSAAEERAERDDLWAGYYLEEYSRAADALGWVVDLAPVRRKWMEASLGRLREKAAQGVFYNRPEFALEQALELRIPMLKVWEEIQSAYQLALDVRERRIVDFARCGKCLDAELDLRDLRYQLQRTGLDSVNVAFTLHRIGAEVARLNDMAARLAAEPG